jgi:hypothetical protein
MQHPIRLKIEGECFLMALELTVTSYGTTYSSATELTSTHYIEGNNYSLTLEY